MIPAAETIFEAAAKAAKAKASVNVDFPFEVNGWILPAGHHRVAPYTGPATGSARPEGHLPGWRWLRSERKDVVALPGGPVTGR